MKIYVATAFTNKRGAKAAMTALRAAGHEIVGDWTAHRGTRNTGVLAREAMVDWNGLRSADMLVILWPGRVNTLIEFGIALGRSIPIFIVGKPNQFEVLYVHHPLVTVVSTFRQLPMLKEGDVYYERTA